MGKSTLYVRFPDETVRYGIYNDTADLPWPNLFATNPEAWAAFLAHTIPDWDVEPDGAVVSVEIADEVQYWPGTAAPNRLVDDGRRVTPGWGGDDYFADSRLGVPGWLADILRDVP